MGNPTIGMLKIHTNLYPSGYGPFGEAKGVSRPQSFTCPISAENDSWIVELFGTHGPSYLASIGVTTRKVRSVFNFNMNAFFTVMIYVHIIS